MLLLLLLGFANDDGGKTPVDGLLQGGCSWYGGSGIDRGGGCKRERLC